MNPEELRSEIIHSWEYGDHLYFPWMELSIFGIDISITKAVLWLWLGALISFLVLFIGSRAMKNRPGAYQVIVEEIYGFGRNSLGGLMGEEGKKWFPYTLSLFVFIVTLNLIGLIPNSFPVTSSISFTLTLAFLTFAIVQYQGARSNGLGTYVAAFAPPGLPAKPIMVPFMFLIEWISEISKPLTLGMRLYANMLAGHLLIYIFLSFILYTGGPTAGGVGGIIMPFVSVPLGLAIYAFEVFVCVLQAYIFAILTQIYIEIAMHKAEH